MASSDNFQQVKVKIDELAKVKDILKNIESASVVTLDIAFNNQTPDAFYRLENSALTALKTNFQTQVNTLWSEVKGLIQEASPATSVS